MTHVQECDENSVITKCIGSNWKIQSLQIVLDQIEKDATKQDVQSTC